jgi:hypothetical protein
MAEPVKPPEKTIDSGIAPPSSSLVQDYGSAGSAEDLYSLLPRATGTALAPRILRSAEVMTRASAPVADVLAVAEKKGGAGTAEGRIAIADATINSFDKFQPETSFLKGLAAGMMGRKDWQNAASQGVIRPTQEFDRDGKGVVAFYAQNSDVPIRVLDKSTGKELTMPEYEARGFGKYKSITDTPGYIDDKKRTELYSENFVKEQGAANVGAAVFPIIGENAKKYFDGLSNLRNYGLSSQEINELHSMSTLNQSVSSAVSSALQEFRQANDSQSLNAAIDKINKVDAKAGLPKIVGIAGENTFKDANGNTFSKQDLMQKMSDFNSRSSQETQWTQNRDQIVKSAVYKKLETLGAKADFDNILNLQRSNELLKADYRSKYGEPPVFASSLPYELGQPMKVGMANAVIDQANAKIAVAYQAFVDKETRNGITPAPGVLAAAFRRSGIPQSISKEYEKDLDAIQAMPDIETAKPKEPAKASIKQRSILGEGQNARLAETSNVGKKIEQKESGKDFDFVSDFRNRKKEAAK